MGFRKSRHLRRIQHHPTSPPMRHPRPRAPTTMPIPCPLFPRTPMIRPATPWPTPFRVPQPHPHPQITI